MKILAISAYYEPEIAASMYICKNLYDDMAAAGMDVVLYTPSPTRGVDDATRKRYSRLKSESKFGGRLTIQRVGMFREGRHPLLRAIRYVLLNLVFIFKVLSVRGDVLFVQSTPPTQGAMAAVLKKLKRIPFVYNVQDIFPDSLVAAKLTTRNSWLWRAGRLLEDFTYRNADKIIVISEGFKRNLMDKGVPEAKIAVVRNWVDEINVYPIARKDNKLFDKYALDRNRFYITYCGNIGLNQNMDLLIEVAEEFSFDERISFVMIGDGAYRPVMEKVVAGKALKNVNFLPFQPYEDIAHVFSLGDVGLVISNAGTGSSSVPSKTWSIMAAQRAVIASFDLGSELDRVISDSKSGLCVPADDKRALVAAIKDMINNENLTHQYAANGRRYIVAELSRAAGTSRYMQTILDSIVH